MSNTKETDKAFQENPIHTGVTKDTASTPGYFRLFIPGLAARYVMRWLVGSEREANLSGTIGRWFGGKGNGIIGSAVEKEAQAIFDHIEKGTGLTTEQAVSKLEARGFSNAAERLAHAKDNHRFYNREWAEEWGDKREFGDFEHAGVDSQESHYKRFKDDVKSAMKNRKADLAYDTSLGLGSSALTAFYASRVASDIKKVFAETIAYEHNKDPKEIGYRDILDSDNALVQETKKNFFKKNAQRFGTDLVFFGGFLTRLFPRSGLAPVSFSDIGVGLKGATLAMEMLDKNTTIFEDLVALIDRKLNPTKGIGDPLSASEIFDLYQKYTQVADPNATFRDALSSQNRDGRDWSQAEQIFTRATELMNETYKYKHPASLGYNIDESANFTLPKFLFLLGHGMIDTYKPRETIAYIEIANKYGMDAVKQVHKAMRREGIALEEAISQYPVNLPEMMSKASGETKAAEQNTMPPTPPSASMDVVPGNVVQDTASIDRHQSIHHEVS